MKRLLNKTQYTGTWYPNKASLYISALESFVFFRGFHGHAIIPPQNIPLGYTTRELLLTVSEVREGRHYEFLSPALGIASF